ncbi:hypothetical protein [Amycolatopsis sp. FDAARGOS 1241]|uniref:hypothetical protein n=1 Tax=Amycolatopsis sp. FDAARGOS 1241 TaxID=2778070 RepID=UPI001950659E|nr:hypothetical protein [Amycolatopsis sp. FDAARGOS 1241]QRP44120.1 hypothetical protein I6J71_33180 [Amycolatopsis sp. FDAARGOS 1241]
MTTPVARISPGANKPCVWEKKTMALRSSPTIRVASDFPSPGHFGMFFAKRSCSACHDGQISPVTASR